MSRPEAVLGLMWMDLPKLGRAVGPEVPPVWRSLIRPAGGRPATVSQGTWAARLSELPAERRAAEVRSALQAEVARVLSVSDPSTIPTDRPLSEL